MLIPTTVKFINGWELQDLGGGDFAYVFTGDGVRKFTLNFMTSLNTSSLKHEVRLSMYKNGAIEGGADISRKIGAGSDVGAMGISATFEVTAGDYIEVYVETDNTCTFTFRESSINITEEN